MVYYFYHDKAGRQGAAPGIVSPGIEATVSQPFVAYGPFINMV